jgi:hypothetical protein
MSERAKVNGHKQTRSRRCDQQQVVVVGSDLTTAEESSVGNGDASNLSTSR